MPGTSPFWRSLVALPLPEVLRSVTVSFPTSMFILSSLLVSGLHEQRADRVSVVDALDRLAEQPPDALHANLRTLLPGFRQRDRIGHDHVLKRGSGDPLDGRAAEHRVACARRDTRGAGGTLTSA